MLHGDALHEVALRGAEGDLDYFVLNGVAADGFCTLKIVEDLRVNLAVGHGDVEWR